MVSTTVRDIVSVHELCVPVKSNLQRVCHTHFAPESSSHAWFPDKHENMHSVMHVFIPNI